MSVKSRRPGLWWLLVAGPAAGAVAQGWAGFGAAGGVAAAAAIGMGIWGVFHLSRRTEKIYQERSVEEGTDVFGGVYGAGGGDLRCESQALRFYGGRKRTLRLEVPWTDVRSVALRRKGSRGSVAAVELRLTGGRIISSLEIADGPRLASSLRAAGVTVDAVGW